MDGSVRTITFRLMFVFYVLQNVRQTSIQSLNSFFSVPFRLCDFLIVSCNVVWICVIPDHRLSINKMNEMDLFTENVVNIFV